MKRNRLIKSRFTKHQNTSTIDPTAEEYQKESTDWKKPQGPATASTVSIPQQVETTKTVSPDQTTKVTETHPSIKSPSNSKWYLGQYGWNNADVRNTSEREVDFDTYTKGHNAKKKFDTYQGIINSYIMKEHGFTDPEQINTHAGNYYTTEQIDKALNDYNQKNGTNYSLDDLNSTVSDVYDIWGGTGQDINLAGKMEFDEATGTYRPNKSAMANLLWSTRLANQKLNLREEAIAKEPEIAKEEPKGDIPDYVPGEVKPTEFGKRKPRLDLSGINLFGGPKVRQPDKLKLQRTELSHPVITQPDVDRPIAEMSNQVNNTIRSIRSTDPATRQAILSGMTTASGTALSNIYQTSSDHTEAKRAQAIPIINQERMINDELTNRERVDDVDYQRREASEYKQAIAQRNNSLAYNRSMKDWERRNREDKQRVLSYNLTMDDYDAEIEKIDNMIKNVPSGYSSEQQRIYLDKLNKQRDEISKKRRQYEINAVYRTGGVIVSRYKKGGSIDAATKHYYKTEENEQKFKMKKELETMKSIVKNNLLFLRQAQDMYKSNLSAIGKIYKK